MNDGFLRGMCLGALVGAAAEVVMMATVDKSTRAHPMRAMGHAVEDAVDSISQTLH